MTTMFINTIYRHARESAGQIAVINNGATHSYADLARAIDGVRSYLLQSDLPDHGVIVRLDGDLYLDWVILLALRSLGRTVVSGPTWEMIESTNIDDITGLVCFSAEALELEGLRTARPDLALVILPLSTIQRSETNDVPAFLQDEVFGDHIIFTSGTTGGFKKLIRKGDEIDLAMVEHGLGLVEQTMREGSCLHNQVFQTWTGPGNWNPIVCWHKGATVIFDHRPDWEEHFNDYPVDITFIAPGLVEKFRSIVASRPDDYPPLKLQIGGGFVNGDSVESFIDAPGIELYVAYGGTEFGIGAMNRVHSKDDLVWLTPLAKDQIEIVDDLDQLVPTGTEGAIRVKLLSTSADAYLDAPETTAQHFRDGYFYPGDMAVQREDGRIRILGRVQDVLNVGGLKIAVAPVEESIRQSLGLENVCVFAVQDNAGKERLAVVLETRQLPDQAVLEAAVGRALRTGRFIVMKLDRFPRGESAMMKINRRKVLEFVRANLNG